MSSYPNYFSQTRGVVGYPAAENETIVMQEAASRASELNWRYLTYRSAAGRPGGCCAGHAGDESRGHAPLSGSRIWTGEEAPVAVMRELVSMAFTRELGSQIGCIMMIRWQRWRSRGLALDRATVCQTATRAGNGKIGPWE